MYNRYIPDGTSYRRIVMEDTAPGTGSSPHRRPERGRGDGARPRREAPGPGTGRGGGSSPLAGLLGGMGGGLNGLLDALHLKNLDMGDLLLLLILLLLAREEDNTEVVITLGLLLLMGLGEDGEESAQPT